MSTCRTPSWSWASAAGPIRYFPLIESQSYTFWNPENWDAFPAIALDHKDPNSLDKLVMGIVDQLRKVNPVRGYSAQEVYYSKYILESSTDDTLCISGKLARAHEPVVIVQDAFTEAQKDMIIDILHITSSGYGLLVCAWPDFASSEVSKECLYLRISVQGAKSPLIAGFFRDRETIVTLITWLHMQCTHLV
jgi:hypothetical protein